MNKKIVKDAMILTAFTLVLGLILGMVNEITKGPIAKVNYEAEQESYRNVFKDADSFEEYKDFDAKKAEDIIAKSDYANDEILSVNTALDKSGEVLGYVISVTSNCFSVLFNAGFTINAPILLFNDDIMPCFTALINVDATPS